jgi:hypothetical protein
MGNRIRSRRARGWLWLASKNRLIRARTHHSFYLSRIGSGFHPDFMYPSFTISLRSAATALFLLLLTACGTKPDGTPYGVDPARTTAGRQAARDSARRPHDAIGMPKGAEVQAVTGASKAGTPLTSPAQ